MRRIASISTVAIIICSFIGLVLAAPSTQLTLVKEVVGGEAVATDWVLTADGTATNDLSGAGWVSGYIAPDTFKLGESAGPPAYTAGNWACVGGGTLDGQSLTLLAGDNVTCTIINTYEPEVVIFDTDLALPGIPDGDGAGTPVCIDEGSGLLVAGCDAVSEISVGAVGTSEVADNSLTMNDIAPTSGYDYTFTSSPVEGNNDLFPVQFTPPSTGTCMVTAGSLMRTSTAYSSDGNRMEIVKRVGPTGTVSTVGNNTRFGPMGANLFTPASNHTSIPVTAGEDTYFGCRVYGVTGVGYINCNITYMCF